MLLGAAALALLAAACDRAPTTIVTSTDTGGIAVTGSGRVTVTPDIAQLHIGVEARAATIAEVRAAAARAQEAVRASLRSNGIEERDIQTQGLSIRPEYGSRPPSTPTPFPPTPRPIPSDGGTAPALGQPEIVAYVMMNTVAVKVRNLETVSRVIDQAVEAGGDNVRLNGIAFGVDQPERFQAEARELAVNDARQRAEALARLTGVELGPPRSINEFGGPTPLGRGGLETAQAAPDSPTPINPGETEIVMQVSIVYEVR
jgi:uncharacterized protein YggE